ncbi:hypothetical protein B0H13DRAFT_2342331 [Mycena leptocephala]|nr:hypothetical protein B0H13DRAFT_2342331 [Mycena leptocephala]
MLGWNPSYSLCIAASVLQTLAAGTANPQEARTIAKRIDNITFPLDERAQFVAQRFTWASAGSPDACTGQIHQDNDFVVAMGSVQFGDGSNCCGKQMTITFQEVTTNATCVDRCMTCLDYGQLEFTKGLFGNFIDPIAGEIFGSWSFIDDYHLIALRRNAARTAVIAGSVSVSVGLLAAVVILFLCVRRRRRRFVHHLLPEQFTNAEEHVSQDDLWLKAESLRTQPVAVVTENDVLPHTNAEDGEETVTHRLRRMEAQLETLLTMGVPEGSPPSYAE